MRDSEVNNETRRGKKLTAVELETIAQEYLKYLEFSWVYVGNIGKKKFVRNTALCQERTLTL
jgi:hypothetical protein